MQAVASALRRLQRGQRALERGGQRCGLARDSRLCGFTVRALTISVLAVAFGSWTQAASAQAATLVGVGNLPGCATGSLSNPQPYMQRFHAKLLRVVVNPPTDGGHALPCISSAHAEGYKVMLSIQWPSGWPVARVKSFFSQELTRYGRYVNSVSVGNEQEIQPPGTSPAKYVSVWRAVEPMIKRMTPRAVRVAGEISPWGFNDLERELRLGLPGIQAVAVHTYSFTFGLSFRQALALARHYRKPLWCTEGLRDGPNSWPSLARSLPLSGMRGAAVAAAWDSNGAPPPSFGK